LSPSHIVEDIGEILALHWARIEIFPVKINAAAISIILLTWIALIKFLISEKKLSGISPLK
jgi:hypothetical protein